MKLVITQFDNGGQDTGKHSEKTKDELKATKDTMRKTIFSVDTIRNNDKLCKHYTGFSKLLSQLFPFYCTTSFSLGFSGEQ